MKKRGKRGISTIIVTVIIIGLSLVAVGIVWFVVRNLLAQGTGGIGLGQFTINIEIQRAYQSGNNLVVDVQRKTGEGNLTGITFVLSNGTDRKTISQRTGLSPLETESFNLNLSEITLSNINEVSIAPLFLSSAGEETLGNVQSTYALQEPVQGLGNPGGNGNNGNNGKGTNGGDNGCTSLGDCPSGTASCTNGVCVPPNCVSETPAPTATCQRLGISCGDGFDNCGTQVACGTCSAGLFCISGACIPVTSINQGTVEDVWPPNSNIYFASKDLNRGIDQSPQIDYQGKYASFPGSAEINCRLIVRFISYHDASAYGKTILEFNFETAVKTGDSYKIWAGQDECLSSLSA